MLNLDLLIGIATGVILFLYGIDAFSREIKAIAGEDLRKILALWTKRAPYGMALGAIVTAFIQSSTATSVLTVSLVNSAIINFRQSIGIMLGTNIGTTVTAFLVAYKLTSIGPWFIVFGFLLSIVRVKYSFFGKALFYFGLVFFALSQLSAITAPLKDDPAFAALFTQLNNPFFGIMAGALVTIVIQSSSVTTGLVVILAQSGGIQLEDAIPIILGANIGTTFTGIIASFSMDTYAKRAATVNTIFNIGGVLLFLPFLIPFTKLIEWIGGTPGEMTAIAHLLFNIVSSVVFVFFINQLEWIASKLIKSDENEIVYQTHHLKKELDDDFSVNLRNVELEVTHYLEVARHMLAAVVSYIDLRTGEGFDRIEKYFGYSTYLAQQCEHALHELAVLETGKQNMDKLARLLRMVDFIRQSVASQRQIAEIPDLMRLPNVEQLTELKAEVFGLSNLASHVYEHLMKYIQTQDRAELHKIDAINAKLTKRINDRYQEAILSTEESSDRLKAFFLGFLTKMLSIKSKLREVRKLSVVYFGQPVATRKERQLITDDA
jgi:phosphate:Na+ symporter